MKFGAAGLSPSDDTDGDGQSNAAEAIAGTNPKDPTSVFKIKSISVDSAGVHLTFPTVAGKNYQAQANGSLDPAGWQNVGTSQNGTGNDLTIDLTTPDAAPRFYRVIVQDVDSDGDGVNDADELMLGFDPQNTHSQGSTGPDDYTAITQGLQTPNTVTVTAANVFASPDGPTPGLFTVKRSGGFNALTVHYSVAGTAVANSDYIPLNGVVTLPMGVNSAQITVTPIANPVPKSGVSVVVGVTNPDDHSYNADPGKATVVINSSATPSGTGLTAQYFDNASTTYTNALNFTGLKVTRIDPVIDFYWNTGQPYTTVGPDNFSAQWQGLLVPTVSGDYVFDLQADDGARLYINNVLMIDGGTAGTATAAPLVSAPISLVAGVQYPIRVEYFETTGAAMVKLRWLVPGTSALASIPAANVFRPSASTTTGWDASYYNNSTLSGTAVKTATESAVYYDWGIGTPDPSIAVDTFSVRWTGQVQPQYSEEYTFDARVDDGVKLWVNGQLIIDKWVTGTTDYYGKITLQAGVRYDIKMEYYENTGSSEAHLYWYSQSQPKQIIPQSRLYPSSGTLAPAAITSATTANALVDGPFSYQVSASNSSTSITVSGLPPGLTFDPLTGLISGVPTQAGDYQILITATNSAGTGLSVLNLHIDKTGESILQEYWSGVAGVNISDIPVTTSPTALNQLSTLEAPSNVDDSFATRIRGYLTAPVTGNYYFWIAGSDSAELWISNDSEPVNKVRRAWTTTATAARSWNDSSTQRSPWLALVAGKQYYVEVLQKAGVGNDNLAVGWSKPGETGSAPGEVVPGYVLSPYVAPADAANPGTLYAANLQAQGTAQTQGTGAATLRLSADETKAVLKLSYANLTGPLTAHHIHCDPYLSNPSQIIFDIDAATPQADGSYIWNLSPVGTLSTADLVQIIKQGAAYINLHTAAYPAGEIRGNFTLAAGSRSFTPPALPPAWTDDHTNANAAARFLAQATFGPSETDMASLQAMPSYEAWINDQISKPISTHLPYVLANIQSNPQNPYPGTLMFNSWWQQSISAPDQLRQRMAFALSEIMVVSEATSLSNLSQALASYYDGLLANVFGNFRDILGVVTMSPTMGKYLDMLRNDKPDLPSGRHANENYAREVQQLFSIGLYRMWPDGTYVLTSKDELVPTYDQSAISGLATVFTGWDYNYTGTLRTSFGASTNWLAPMREVPARHFTGPKRLFDNVVLPGLSSIGGQALDPYATPTSTQLADTNFQALPAQELNAALDAIFNHPNVGPFICRRLIQRLVTSNPSESYVYRVVQKFNDNGQGVRGDMTAVIKAILLDYEARSPVLTTQPHFGKQREPLLRVAAAARAFPAPSPISGTYSQNGSRAITVTTASPHRLATGNNVALQFTSGSPLPTSTSYAVTVTGTNTFTVPATGSLDGTYSQSDTTITVTCSSHGLLPGNGVYLKFTSGGASEGEYVVATVPDSKTFTVAAVNSQSTSGNVILAFYKGGYTQTGTTITVNTSTNAQVAVGDSVYIDFTSGTAVDGVYPVTSVLDDEHFTVTAATSVTQNQPSLVVAALSAPPLTRSGNVTMAASTWNMGNTDTDLAQTPLRSPTVFNFFFPNYMYPGPLASAGMTTPEFQLTSDTNLTRQNNLLALGVLYPSATTSGLSSFKTGSGALVMDFGPWMSKTSDALIPALVDEMSTLLTGGQLSAAMKTIIVNYVTGPATGTKNFPMSATPTDAQKRDRVRAIVHLIVTSPDFAIQK